MLDGIFNHLLASRVTPNDQAFVTILISTINIVFSKWAFLIFRFFILNRVFVWLLFVFFMYVVSGRVKHYFFLVVSFLCWYADPQSLSWTLLCPQNRWSFKLLTQPKHHCCLDMLILLYNIVYVAWLLSNMASHF